MVESFPPSNPVMLLRIIVLLCLQDVQGWILYLLSFLDHITDSEAVRQYIEDYPDNFLANIDEKQYLIQRYVPQLLEELVSIPTSLQKIRRILFHPYIETVYLGIFSFVFLLLLYHHTQVYPELLQQSQWPRSVDLDDDAHHQHAKDDTTFRRAQSVLHMKSFESSTGSKNNGTSSQLPAIGRVATGIIDRQYMPQKTAVQPRAQFAAGSTKSTTSDSTNFDNAQQVADEAAFEREKGQREAAKANILKQFPPPPNPLAKKPSRMRTILKATMGMGLKRTNSMSSVVSDATNNSLESADPPKPITNYTGGDNQNNNSNINNSNSASGETKSNLVVAESAREVVSRTQSSVITQQQQQQPEPQQVQLPQEEFKPKPKLLLRFDSQDPSTLRVIEEPSPTASSASSPPASPLPYNNNMNNNNNISNNNNSTKAYLTPPRPPPASLSRTNTNNNTPIAMQTPYSTVSTLTPDSQFLSMVQRHRSNEDMKNNASNNSNNNSRNNTINGIPVSLLENQNSRDDEDDQDDDNASMFSDGTGYAASDNGGTILSSQASGYLDDANAPPEVVMERSIARPTILIGWRVSIPGYGTGLILSIKKKRFATTKFVIQLENDQIVALKLQRGKNKGNVPFHLLRKVR